MTFDPVPWVVGGGAEHSPEVARLLAYAATGGAEGIVNDTDLKVAPTAVPSNSVRVLAGACLIRSDAAGGAQQTYVGRNVSEDVVAVAATGSGAGRSDLIVASIEDPFMAGEPWADPANPKVGPYIFTRVIPNVQPGTTVAPAGSNAVALARIDIPANTGTITSDMVKDLRKLALPRRHRELFRFQPGTDKVGQEINDPNGLYQHWPSWEPTFVVPDWATHVVAVMNISGVLKPIGGDIIGDLKLEWCNPGQPGPSIGSTVYEEPANTDWARVGVLVSGETNVTADRGRTKSIRIGARRHLQNSAAGATLRTVGGSNFVLDVEFQQRAV